ncbi:MAG: metallophosphoesterase [Ignavibacteriales bacterium]|nr:MAG: metallophosphoesterase [Ignavibacteriales bacterium]
MSFYLRIGLGLLTIILLEFYFSRKISRALKIYFPSSERYIKRGKNIFLIALNIFPAYVLILWIISRINETRASLPENFFFDYFVMYPFWVCAMIVLQITLFFLVLDILKIPLLLFSKSVRERFKRFEAKIIIAITVLFFIYVPARIIYDYNTVSIRITEHKVQNLHPGLNNLRIAFISDTQADRYTDEKRLMNFIDKVNSTNPDLVLIAGDVITSTPDYIGTAAEYLGKLKSKYGVYTCVGDHDNWAYREDNPRSIREVTEELKKYNVKMLDNDRLTLDINNSKVNITFVTNTYVERIAPSLLDSLSNHSSDYDLKIFLTHQPREYLIDAAQKHNYDLFLAGHTHGGQITLLFPFFNLTPTLIETDFVKGDRKFGKMLAIVTRGLGMSLAPIRYNSTPEVTLISISSDNRM